jgi:hypothetical protein
VKARWKRWARALLVVPLLAFALSASSRLEIRCALTGLLMPDCCPEAAPVPPAPAPQHASISERDCCERTVIATDKLPATGPEAALELAPLAVGRVAPLPADGVFPALKRAARASLGRARSSPPPFLLTHAFLI